jgi:hypothetical protein
MISGYGLENLILKRANLPSCTPLVPYYDHGWMLNDDVNLSIQDNPSNIHLTWNARIKKQHCFIKNKIFFITGSPFLFYKEDYEIKKKKKKNLLFFFSHSTPKINQILNLDRLAEQLNSLPQALKPIDVCMHYYDLKKYKYFFENNGFKVLSAGNVINNDYAKNFYEILSDYSHACSNTLGTYVLYSINLNIPFFLFGNEPTMDNYGNDKNSPRHYKLTDFKNAKIISRLFSKINHKVTEDQKKMADFELGLYHRIGPKQLREVILKALLESCTSFSKFTPLLRSLARNSFFKIKSFL